MSKKDKRLLWDLSNKCWKLELTQGAYTLFDEDDLVKILKYNWGANLSKGVKYVHSVKSSIKMHRLILNANVGEIVDHINHDTLDNRKSNLRICNQKQNVANGRIRKHNKSGYKGVSFHKSSGKWQAQIGAIRCCLGIYDTPEAAARVYDKALIKKFGEFAATNKSLGLLK